MSERTRAYIYRVLTAAVPILVIYGLLDESTVSLWLGFVGAVLGLGEGALASVNTSTKRDVSR